MILIKKMYMILKRRNLLFKKQKKQAGTLALFILYADIWQKISDNGLREQDGQAHSYVP